MVQKYYTTKEAAEILGVSPAEVNSMRERNELRGYRDGTDWKFKAEDIEEMVRQRRTGAAAPPSFSDDEIVLGLDDLSPSVGSSASGTVIGGEKKPESADDEIQLGGSDLDLLNSQTAAEAAPSGGSSVISAGAGLDDELLPLEEEAVPSDAASAGKQAGDSAVDLDGGLDDDEIVIGGSGSGSDITLGGDSGISLVDANDSGISLEEPLELATGDESLELIEDDMLMLDQSADTEAPTQLKTDEDFMLTPFEEVEEGEETESGSQVIALDTEPGTGSSPGMAGLLGEAPLAPSMTPATAIPGGPFGAPAPGVGMGPAAAPAPAYAAAMMGVEAPWGTLWNVLIIVTAVLLLLCGMMTFDLVRNMWSWNGPYSLNSSIMDAILSFLPK
ncbi:helix-turn-helix domain-containing protein [Thermopirellula anaerolimosa]